MCTNDSPARLPFQRMQCVTNAVCIYTMIVPELTVPQEGDDKRIQLCFETQGLHQDCPGIHLKYCYKVTFRST